MKSASAPFSNLSSTAMAPKACCANCAHGQPCRGSLALPVVGMGDTSTATAPSTTPSWLPIAVAFASLAAGVGAALYITRPLKSHAEMVHEERTLRRRRR